MRYAIVIEKAEGNYSASVPDLHGCVAAGDPRAALLVLHYVPEAARSAAAPAP